MKNILIIGATSAIAEAVARRFAQSSARFYLIARHQERLQALAADLVIRGAATVDHATMDVNAIDRYQTVLNEAYHVLGKVDVVVIAHGVLSDQKECEQSINAIRASFETNALSVMGLLTDIANRMEAQHSGTIAVISSVAGDRGRQSAYVYGSAKAAVTTFLQGLRNRLYKSDVHVLTIKPGFVDTPMTAAFKKGALWASPESVACDIETAILRHRDVIYTPSWWRIIMFVVKSVPERIFKRLSL